MTWKSLNNSPTYVFRMAWSCCFNEQQSRPVLHQRPRWRDLPSPGALHFDQYKVGTLIPTIVQSTYQLVVIFFFFPCANSDSFFLHLFDETYLLFASGNSIPSYSIVSELSETSAPSRAAVISCLVETRLCMVLATSRIVLVRISNGQPDKYIVFSWLKLGAYLSQLFPGSQVWKPPPERASSTQYIMLRRNIT